MTKEAYAAGADEWILTNYDTSASINALLDGLKTIWDDRYTNAFAPQLWTMHYEFYTGTVCLIVLVIFYNKRFLRIITYMAILCASGRNGDVFSSCIYAGALAGECCIYIKNRIPEQTLYNKWVKVLFGILAVTSFNYSVMLKLGMDKDFRSGVVMALAIGLCYFVFDNVDMPKFLKFLAVVGKYSFSIYLVHFLMIVSLGGLLFVNIKNPIARFITVNLLVVFATAVVAVLFEKFVIRPVNKLFKYVYGKIQ